MDSLNWKSLQTILMTVVHHLGSQTRQNAAMFLFGSGAIFLLTCQRFKIRPTDVLERLDRLFHFMDEGRFDGGGQVIEAVRMYCKEELNDPDD